MTAKDLELLRMARACTFPGNFKNDLLKLGIEEQLASDMWFAFFSYRNGKGEFDFLGFLMDYCYGQESWTEAILIYINAFTKV